MKHSKSATRGKFSALPELRFEDQQLTSYAGLVVFQQLFADLGLKRRLRHCFSHCHTGAIYAPCTIMLLLIVHMLLGYRRLRHVQYYGNDPLVRRVLGLHRLPDVSTISRRLASFDGRSVARIEQVQQSMVLETMGALCLGRITLDFDGSVMGTCRRAEGVAMGFNRHKKGQRSYYPLFCTVAQSAQVLAVAHRSGNVHDSNGAEQFIGFCIEKVRQIQPNAVIEVRMDGAFFSEKIIAMLDARRVQYTISVPVERYNTIKVHVDERRRWRYLDPGQDYFERCMTLKSWQLPKQRFIFVRQRYPVQHKTPVQLDLFEPRDFDYQYKAIITNKTTRARRVIGFHDGRGAQEALFAEMKSQASLAYIPANTWNANKVYLLASVFAHNLARELQMRHLEQDRCTTTKRPPLWQFTRLDTIRKAIIQRAGRLIRPQGILTLSMSTNERVKKDLLTYLPNFSVAA